MTDTHLTPGQLSGRWGLTERTLQRWRWQGCGPKFLKMGGRILYRIVDIEAFETKNLFDATLKDQGVPVNKFPSKKERAARGAA